MVETDWREILSFSQRELGQADKEKLCESISWMEADDIELNFTDLKTLFRLAQDILKYKSEQVNNLLGKLESANRKSKKGKTKAPPSESPTSTESAFDTIAHQEEVIRANKEILEQLYTDIAELEGKKKNLEKDGSHAEGDSNSSRDVLSEMETVVQLENEVAMKNKHIRKLLSDVNVLEDENAKLKEKVPVLKDKLLEATQLIDNLTEQLLTMNNDCSQLKDLLGRSEKAKAELSCQIESLRKELFQKDSSRENIYEEVKSKVQHWKHVAKSKKAELEALSAENEKLKQSLVQVTQRITSSPKVITPKVNQEELKIKELQEKLIEASNEMEQSANLITLLRAENRQIKNILEDRDTPESTIIDNRNESDDGKQRILINKLKKKIKSLTASLHGAEQMVAVRERELAEIASELQLLQSDEGVNSLLQGLKLKKKELKIKDEGIKSLVQEVNNMSQRVSDLQLENETLRQEYNIPATEAISTDKLVKKYRDLEQNNTDMCKEIRRLENKLINIKIKNRNLSSKVVKATKFLTSKGHQPEKIEEIFQNDSDTEDNNVSLSTSERKALKCNSSNEVKAKSKENTTSEQDEMKILAEENEGLRKGLQEILDFLKDNSTTSSGILALQCPSLEALLRSMEARHAAGWFAPHMATIMELRVAIGGKDALLTALHQARKETFDIMTQLSQETKKSSELERKIQEIEKTNLNTQNNTIGKDTHDDYEFGTWMSEKEQSDIDFNNSFEIDDMLKKGNTIYEQQLKKGLQYFHEKFKTLYDKISMMAIQAADDNNKWSIQEEQYKAQLESLQAQIQRQGEDDISDDNSPGLISVPCTTHLERKCTYLEDSYKYIRTLNENIKNENMDAKRQMMALTTEYETEIQRLILDIVNLTDKLRNSIPIDLFWKQNYAYNEIIMKHRKVIEGTVQCKVDSVDLLKRLDNDKLEIINNFQRVVESRHHDQKKLEKILSNIEESVLKKQIEILCKEIEEKTKKIENLEKRNTDVQDAQSKLIDESLASITTEELNLIKNQLHDTNQENKVLKEQCRHVSSQLDIALLQLQENQQRQMSNDMEVNLLRHQVLDLQSNSDNKAIVARLSGEVLVAHLQASESNKKIEQLISTLNKEKESRIEAEEMFKARQKIFDVYSFRYESKFRYMFEVMQVLRQQYQGSVPLASIENYLNNIEDVSRETRVINEKLQDIEDLRSNLMAKHSVFDQILDVSRNKCYIDNNSCSHKIKAAMMESMHSRELDHITKKLKMLEQFHEDLIRHCNDLEKTLILVNQGFEKSRKNVTDRNNSDGEINLSLELEDIPSDDDTNSRKSQTITLPKPQVLKPLKSKSNQGKNGNDNNGSMKPKEDAGQIQELEEDNTLNSPVRKQMENKKPIFSSVLIQTSSFDKQTSTSFTQTIEDEEIKKLKHSLVSLREDNEQRCKDLRETLLLVQQKNKENLVLASENLNLEASVQGLQNNCKHKDRVIETLRCDVDEIRNELDNFRRTQIMGMHKKKDLETNENKSLLIAIQQLENDKNMIAAEYKELLNNEREEYSNTLRNLNVKVMELQSKLDRKGSDSSNTSNEALKDVVNKYTVKIVELEDKSFKLQSELDECKSEISTYQSEVDRWKDLATERLTKMEQLNAQLEERHCHEVESYKQENQHWLSQLNDTQREHLELRTRLSEQKAMFLKQLAGKDGTIEQMRSAINNLKTQIMNMHTMISVHDPSFDLSAIVEVDEASDGVSQPGSDRLEIKFDSTGELNDTCDEFARIGSSSTTIWQEPVIERLRHDKQMAGKQNAILRRQIKALASRERRARLDAQNLKNQVFRISSSGVRVATAESAALHNKIATLQAQLTSARRDTHSSIALWDKWKRAQQSAERWKERFEDKCQDVKKLEASVQLAKSAVLRLEREKRVLMARITELKGDNQLSIEKQDSESPEKSHRSYSNEPCSNCADAPPLSNHALLERIQAQQRRIVALTLAEKGNEHLVSEYEKALAQMTSLKSQVLKLESALLEAQIRSPLQAATPDPQPELQYWKSYCEMLKEENVQLSMRLSSLEAAPAHTATTHAHRVNDLEQTVLTLRGLVSKLQSEQKSSTTSLIHKRVDSRPSSGRSVSDKPSMAFLEAAMYAWEHLGEYEQHGERLTADTRRPRHLREVPRSRVKAAKLIHGPTRLETHRIEIVNLKRSIQDKDLLLERSKEMLKIAAEREDELLRENSFLRRQLNDLNKPKEGFLSA